MPKKIIVKFKQPVWQSGGRATPWLATPAAGQILSKYRLQAVRPLFEVAGAERAWSSFYLQVKAADGFTAAELADSLEREAAVEWAEPNHRYRVQGALQDSLFPQQWALRKVKAPQAWKLHSGDSAVIVGVIDTGVDYLHEDLQGQLWVNRAEDLNHNGRLDSADVNGVDDDGNGYVDDVIGWDFTHAPDFPDGGDYLNPDNNPMDEFPGGHGTGVAGIIAAARDNGAGISGAAPGSRVMALRAGTAGGFLEEDDVAEAILYAVHNGCRIINMSFGDKVYSHLLKDAVDYGIQKGVLFVSSAGNSGNSVPNYPAAYDETISVSATTGADRIASFSSFGSKIDLSAPGSQVLSLVPGNLYGSLSGTSFSAPMVSAGLALLWSQDTAAAPQEVKGRLLAGCADLGASGWDPYFGQGRMDIYQSMAELATSRVSISQPANQSGTAAEQVAVTGTANSSGFQKYVLRYGAGSEPAQWTVISESAGRIVEDTLGIWQTAGLPDSLYTLELQVTNSSQQTEAERVQVYLDRTPPAADSLSILPLYIQEHPGFLVEVKTDDQTTVTLHLRQNGAVQFNREIHSAYLSQQHHFLISREDWPGSFEFYLQVKNSAGLETRLDNEGNFYHFDLSSPGPLNLQFQKIAETAGGGYVYPQPLDFDQDQVAELPLLAAWPGQTEAHLSMLQFRQGQFTHFESDLAAFPRDVRDVTGDGKPELFAGYGNQSFLFPGQYLPQFSGSAKVSPQQDFWISRCYDFGNDGTFEILALHQNDWYLYRLENADEFTVSLLQKLENPTQGENQYGIPHALITDLNQDSRPEIIIGDYDGDLIVYQSSGALNFQPVWQGRLPGSDATYLSTVGNFYGDGVPRLAVASKKLADYTGESAVERQYWNLTIWKWANVGLQLEDRINFQGVSQDRQALDGLTAADYDGDGIDELIFLPFPRFYYLDVQQNNLEVRGFMNGFRSNGAPYWQNGRFLLVTDSTLQMWALPQEGQRPPAPQNFSVASADSGKICLEWQAAAGADYYLLERIYQGQTTVLQVRESAFCDSMVVQGTLYQYQVAAVDSSYPLLRSFSSAPLQVRAENPPELVDWQVVTHRQILLSFSKDLGDEAYRPGHYFVLPDSVFAAGVIRSGGSRQALVSFGEDLPIGRKLLLISDLQNRYGVPFYRDTLRVFIAVHGSSENPYVEQAEMLSRTHLKLRFSRPMRPQSIEDPQNYQLFPDDRVVSAVADSSDASVVHLFLTGNNLMGSLGVDYYLEVGPVEDFAGRPLQTEAGNRFLIRRMVNDLSRVLVFPNPWRAGQAENEITFGNLPYGSELFIYNVNGRLIARFKVENYNGGLSWNMRNGAGEPVSSGVYLFLAAYNGSKKTGKFVIVR
ncbi:MAG: S8 family serine peptidase [Calditrichia bacterium]